RETETRRLVVDPVNELQKAGVAGVVESAGVDLAVGEAAGHHLDALQILQPFVETHRRCFTHHVCPHFFDTYGRLLKRFTNPRGGDDELTEQHRTGGQAHLDRLTGVPNLHHLTLITVAPNRDGERRGEPGLDPETPTRITRRGDARPVRDRN